VGFECLGPTSDRHRRELADYVSRHGLTGVRWHGFVPHDEGYRVLARCRIGLAVLADIPNYRESLPTKIFEYMALGLPVIASNFPLYRRVVEEEHVGICVNPADPAALASAIGQLLDDPQRAAAMGARGREAVRQRYRWGKEESKLLRLYEELLGPPTPRPA
jgi:glycosyltransferase involved in cell wall biosynthesis